MARSSSNAAVAPAAPAVRTESRSSTVTVACKIPHGIIMQLCKETKVVEDTQAGPRERTRFDRVGERVFIRGNSYPVSPAPGFPERGPQAGGFALTYDVDAEFWAEWLKQNSRSPMVKNGLIFATPTTERTTAQALEHKTLRSGLEPLSMEGDPRVPRPSNAAVGAITKADVATV